MTITEAKLDKRVVKAAAHFLKEQGMKIIDKDFSCAFGSSDLVAVDEGGAIRFVFVRACTYRMPPQPEIGGQERRRLERVAVDWLSRNEDRYKTGASVSFDFVDVGIFGENCNLALLRYYQNVLGVDDAITSKA